MTDRLPELLDATTVYVARKRSTVLYVGVTGRNLRRLHAHARVSGWWRQATRIDLHHVASREEALALERELIERSEPEFNTVHNGVRKDRERAAAGLLTVDGVQLEIAGDRGLAKHLMRMCPSVTLGQKQYVQRDDVLAWLEANVRVVPPGARQ